MTSTMDYKLLAARILRPKRSDPWPARKLIRGMTDPAEVWAALSKTLPPEIATHPARRFERKPFVASPEGGSPTPGLDVVEIPPTIGACLAVALDHEGIAFAEDRAREIVRRLEGWGVAPREKIIWSIVPTWPGNEQGGEDLFLAPVACMKTAAKVDKKATIALGAAFRQGAEPVMTELATRGETPQDQALCEGFVDASGFATEWRRAVETEVEVPAYEYAPGKIVPCAGKRFADIPDPYEPLVELIMRGYWLSGATDDALVMVAVEAVGKQ